MSKRRLPIGAYARTIAYGYLFEVTGHLDDGRYLVAYCDQYRSKATIFHNSIIKHYPTIPYHCGQTVRLVDNHYLQTVISIADRDYPDGPRYRLRGVDDTEWFSANQIYLPCKTP